MKKNKKEIKMFKCIGMVSTIIVVSVGGLLTYGYHYGKKLEEERKQDVR